LCQASIFCWYVWSSMKPNAGVVYNRSDCPYGCGTRLAPNLRWQGTPCQGCGRPLYPLSETRDSKGKVIWPPSDVPRPPEAGLPGVTVWYVVTEEAAPAGVAVSWAESLERVNRSEEGCLLQVLLIGGVILVAVALFYVLILAP
jgi:hypothetical protein